MATDTPKQNILLGKSDKQFSTPVEMVLADSMVDPRSPMQNRTPINMLTEGVVSLDQSQSQSTPITSQPQEESYNPLLDPRSPLYEGNRTPIQLGQIVDPLLNQENEALKKPSNQQKNGKKENGKNGSKKGKVVITQKPIKRQIAFNDNTNVVSE